MACSARSIARATGAPPHVVYNLGNHRSEKLMDFIAAIESAMGRKAEMNFEPMQPGDVPATYADIDATQAASGLRAEDADQRGRSQVRGVVQGSLPRLTAIKFEQGAVNPHFLPRACGSSVSFG